MTHLRRWWAVFPRLLLVIAFICVFLVAIELFSGSFNAVGTGTANKLIGSVTNPFAGLAVGVLATVLVQSSSVTTSTVVGLVGSGQVPLDVAVPMIMGANIGTTITNTVVSLGHVTRTDEFRRAFAGATVHDFFNLLTVSILFPLELSTGILQKTATRFAAALNPSFGAKFPNPIKTAVKWSAGNVEHFLGRIGFSGGWLALAMFILALGLIMMSLYFITKNMRFLMANRIEQMLNQVLARSGLLGLVIGILITVSVQSSSITTSLLIPMFGAGVLELNAAFPIMMGANIGTTITALLAAMVAGKAGLIVALVHLLFNLAGTLMFFPIPRMRSIPIWCANKLADVAARNRLVIVVYVGVVFVLIPSLGVFIFNLIFQT